jgi:hypothetical protein
VVVLGQVFKDFLPENIAGNVFVVSGINRDARKFQVVFVFE